MTKAQILRFEVDSDRDGVVEPGEPGRWSWEWKQGGLGAVALPDLGQTTDRRQLTTLRLVAEGFPSEARLLLSLDPRARFVATVLAGSSDSDASPTLGLVVRADGKTEVVSTIALPAETTELYLQPRRTPGAGFDGLIELAVEAHLQGAPNEPALLLARDRTVIRVSPWIMTPNTCEPVRVFVVQVDDDPSNVQFVSDLERLVAGEGLELVKVDPTTLPQYVKGYADRWIQDEIEFGYVSGPGEAAFIVVDGPRNGGLDEVGLRDHLGSDIGSILLDASRDFTTGLDGFGNLEVSPPVTVDAWTYPLGRIVLGTRAGHDDEGRKASLALRSFLYDQMVQTPFEIDTDWLAVGHVDEIVSFVPAPAPDSFLVLVADPRAARGLFDHARSLGLGSATLWRGQRVKRGGESAEQSVDDLLADSELWDYNEACSDRLRTVVQTLVLELGLESGQIVPIPVVFEETPDGAGAYFPDMVNHLVLGELSIVPKPYGPLDSNGTDLLEKAFCDALPHRRVSFIDDWLSYHKLSGEVHCGTNVLRRPIPNVNWWDHKYRGVWNAWNDDA